jgi:hypothetical protein
LKRKTGQIFRQPPPCLDGIGMDRVLEYGQLPKYRERDGRQATQCRAKQHPAGFRTDFGLFEELAGLGTRSHTLKDAHDRAAMYQDGRGWGNISAMSQYETQGIAIDRTVSSFAREWSLEF